MKAAIIFLLITTTSIGLVGQAAAQDSLAEDTMTYFLATLPEFPGGNEAFWEYLMKNVKYPEEERRKKIEGTVHVRFVIDKTGKVKDVEIMPGTEDKATEAMKAEAIRVVSQMPNWTPGTKVENGEKINATMATTIKFKL
jgi:protein TonB